MPEQHALAYLPRVKKLRATFGLDHGVNRLPRRFDLPLNLEVRETNVPFGFAQINPQFLWIEAQPDRLLQLNPARTVPRGGPARVQHDRLVGLEAEMLNPLEIGRVAQTMELNLHDPPLECGGQLLKSGNLLRLLLEPFLGALRDKICVSSKNLHHP